jgi:cyclomaltodextrinase
LRLAALCQFTLAGPPIVYYGTEVGLSQTRDCRLPNGQGRPHEARAPMLWGAEQDSSLLGYYRALGDMRRAHPTLWRGKRKTLTVDAPVGTWAYARQGDDEVLIAVLNTTEDIAEISIPVGGLGIADGAQFEDLLDEEVFAVVDGKLALRLLPMSGVVVAPIK